MWRCRWFDDGGEGCFDRCGAARLGAHVESGGLAGSDAATVPARTDTGRMVAWQLRTIAWY